MFAYSLCFNLVSDSLLKVVEGLVTWHNSDRIQDPAGDHQITMVALPSSASAKFLSDCSWCKNVNAVITAG